jgi:hypothetical protein
MISSTAGAAPLCADIHSPALGNDPMVRVQPMPVIGNSYLKIEPVRLKQDTESLATLVNLLAQTSGVKLDPKLLEKKNQVVLGLLIPNSGYSLEMEYKADGRDERKLVLQEISMISPTLNRKVISKQALSSEAFELVNDGMFDLKDSFPTGVEVKAQVPLVIDQKLMDDFQKFYPNVENFNNAELRNLTKDRKLGRLNILSHFRKLKEVAKEVFIKYPFKRADQILLTVLLLSNVTGPANKHEHPKVETPTVATKQWVSDLNLSFAMSIGSEAKSEILAFNQEIQNQMQKKTGVPMDFTQPRIKLGESDFVWLVEKPEIQKTYVAFTHNKNLATVEMFFVEIDPVKYPKIVSALKNQKMQVKVQ